jgi:hypothetical protein
LLAVGVPRGARVRLVVARQGHPQRLLTGTPRGGTVLFVLRVRGKRAWSVRLRVVFKSGAVTRTALHQLRPLR